MQMKCDILAICINYWNEQDTINYVNALLGQQRHFRLDIVVVDNSGHGEDDCPLNEIESNIDNVHVYKSENNLGYFGGASWGLEKYLTTSEMPEWIIVSNTDIYFENQHFLSILVDLYKGNPPEVVAPSIYSDITGLNQNPFMKKRPPAWKMHFYRLVFRFSWIYRVYKVLHFAKSSLSSRNRDKKYIACAENMPYPIYAPHGSIIVFNRKYFDNGGTLNYGSFLFDEEIFIGETAHRIGLEVLYEPRIIVFHKEHATTTMTREMLRYKYQSSKYCATTFFSK